MDFESLCQTAAAAIVANGNVWLSKPNPPASPKQIEECEAAVGVRLPTSYRRFLSERNGIELGVHHVRSAGYVAWFTLLSTDEIVERTREAKDMAEDVAAGSWISSLVAFVDTSDGDLCLFNVISDAEAPVVDGWHEESPDDWRESVIASDFWNFIERAFAKVSVPGENQDFRYWWDPDWRYVESEF